MFRDYDVALSEIKETLSQKQLHKAEKMLYQTMFDYANDMMEESKDNADIMIGLYNLFYYIKRINFTEKIPTACVNLMNGYMNIGIQFFTDQIHNIQDCMFIIFHERNHSIIDFVSKKTKGYNRDKEISHELVNFAEDGYVNGNVLSFIQSDLPEKYYNSEEIKQGKKEQYSFLSSNTYGFYKYIKEDVCKNNFDKHLFDFIKKYNKQRVSTLLDKTNDIKDLSCIVTIMHNNLYKSITNNNLIRNNNHTEEEKKFYETIKDYELSFEYVDWMNAFFKWYKNLPEDAKQKFDQENDVAEIVIQVCDEDSFDGEDDKEENNKEKDNNKDDQGKKKIKIYIKSEKTRKQQNEDDKKRQDEDKKKGKNGEDRFANESCMYKFPDEETKEDSKRKRIINDIKSSNNKDILSKMINESELKLKSNILQVVADNVTKNIISCNVNNCDLITSSFITPSVISRRDLFTLGTGHIPVVYNKNIELKGIKFKLYVDVSGSMDRYLPIVGKLIKDLKEYVDRVFMFSTEVKEQPMNNLDYYYSTGGTDFDVVAQSILDNKFSNVIVLTDGESYMSSENTAKMKRFVKNLYYIHVGRDKPDDVFSKLTNHKIENIVE